MDEFRPLVLMAGLVVGALLGTASGWLAVRAAAGGPVDRNPLRDGGRSAIWVFWAGFVLATLGGLTAMSSSQLVQGMLLNGLAALLGFAATAFASRLVRDGYTARLNSHGDSPSS